MRGAAAGDKYLEMRVLSATPEQLVVILYDHLLTQLQRAQLSIEVGQADARMMAFDRARKAVTELLLTLDKERGGAIAGQLDGLSAGMLGELIEIGVRPELERLGRLIAMVQELREAFDAAVRVQASGGMVS